jgi:putative pyrimidine permease RutG
LIDSRNIFIGGVPVVLATVMQTPLQIGDFQLDGIGVATFLSIILYQVLQGYDGLRSVAKNIISCCNKRRKNSTTI